MAYLDLINAVVDGDQIVKVKVRDEKAHWSELMFGARSRYFLELEMRSAPFILTIEYD